MSTQRIILAIDHGTSGVKASLVTVHGRVLASDSEKTPIRFLPGGGAEQDPGLWWDALLAVASRLVGSGVVRPADIAALCVSSTFSSTVAVDREGCHLMNAITWMDSRGAPYVKRLMKGFPSFMGYGLPQVFRWLPKTAGAPTISGKDDIAHALLIKHEYPDVYEKTFLFLPSKDYINLRLTGEFAATYDSVHLFWLTDIRDTRNIHYDEELVRMSGLDRSKLPPLRGSTDVVGTLRSDVARRIGLPDGVKVVAGSPDHQCACIGSGAVRDYEGHLYIGTSSWVQCIVPFKKTDVIHSIASFPTAIPGRYQSVNEQDIAGGAIDFLAGLMGRCCGIAGEGGLAGVSYEALTEAASRVPPGSHGLIVTPWLNGERTPVDDTTVRGGIHNLSTTTTFDHIVRAFFEGVALNTRWSLQYVERFVGRRLDPITIVGGGGRSALWCRIFADVLGRKILQPKDPMQANARGAAFIASVGLGEISFDDIPSLMEYERTYEPDPANGKVYDQLFKEFVGIYRNNRAMYRRLNRI
ncbi:MAG TPA: FGGY-family carbohydrate kinase [Deltaproteobacteria bacterium]|nr:FGGY-family carbohydrate kinase [Deltaproteobacteria bacterium]